MVLGVSGEETNKGTRIENGGENSHIYTGRGGEYHQFLLQNDGEDEVGKTWWEGETMGCRRR